jgi:hypothetical protein
LFEPRITPDYWKGPFYRLEAEGLECVLADAKQVKNLPGRPKRDPADSRWLAACFERGAVTACFVATPEFRIIRLHTRYRRDLTEERTREKQRAEKLLESDLLTEPPSVSAVQVGRASEQAISEGSGRSKLPRPLRCLTSVSATETGHTGLNQSATFSSLPIFDVSCSGSLALLQSL